MNMEPQKRINHCEDMACRWEREAIHAATQGERDRYLDMAAQYRNEKDLRLDNQRL